MKKYTSVLSFLILIFGIYWAFHDQKPTTIPIATSETEFSVDKALVHLQNISQEIHHVGTEGHKKVQNYLVQELTQLGLEPSIQSQTVVNKKWFSGTTVENILARIEGTDKGKALLLLSHYDSNPNIAIGASDAGSGVVTILEAVRAFLAKGKKPKNDIIILFSDAEELGLLGAKAFVDFHPWAKEVGLVLNFEARGSGGPSYMLMETNGKNSKMISEFLKATPNYPTSNSLLYSIYKKLPNDTDLTVFREEGDINGFNFAFIGDHFDYHTMQDTYERLDRTTLAHQADYLMQTLNYFAFSNINDLNSDVDHVFVNFPILKMISYPFSWVTTLWIVAAFLLLLLTYLGIVLNRIRGKDILKGFVPSLFSIAVCGGLSFGLWQLILVFFPEYNDLLHGFTYNGYWFVIAFVCLNLWILFFIYQKFVTQENSTSLFIAPIVLWLVINFVMLKDFKGAGFLIIPVFIAEIILAISIVSHPKNTSKILLFSILSIPSVYIVAPLVKSFPVGLGLKILFVSAILVALLFGLLIPVLCANKSRKAFGRLSAFLTLVFFVVAFFNSGFSTDKKKPNSLVYVQNSNDSVAYWGTYNKVLDPFIQQKLGERPQKGGIPSAETKSKYNTRFSYHQKAPFVSLPTAQVAIFRDTIEDGTRLLEILITPKGNVRKLELSSKDSIGFKQLMVNTFPVNNGKEYGVKKGSFLIYHFGNQDKELLLQMALDTLMKPEIILNEISDDLLTHPLFSVKPRSEDMMPMPFVTNDAIIRTKKIQL